MLTLQHTDETLEAHTGIDNVHSKFLERTVGFTIKLHKNKVPDLNNLRVILVYELTTTLARCLTLFWCTGVNMNLRTRTTRTGITHLPKVIMLVTIDDMILGDML